MDNVSIVDRSSYMSRNAKSILRVMSYIMTVCEKKEMELRLESIKLWSIVQKLCALAMCIKNLPTFSFDSDDGNDKVIFPSGFVFLYFSDG